MAETILQNDEYRGGAQNHPAFLKEQKALAEMRRRGISIPAVIPVDNPEAMKSLKVNLSPTNGVIGAKLTMFSAARDNMVAHMPWYPAAPLTFSLPPKTGLALRLMLRYGKLDREVMLEQSDGHNELPSRIAQLRSAGVCIASWPIGAAQGVVDKLLFYTVVGHVAPFTGEPIPGSRRLVDVLVEQMELRLTVQRERANDVYRGTLFRLDQEAADARKAWEQLNEER